MVDINDDLKVFVIGKTQSGKTTICRIISDALEKNNIPNTYHDEDDYLIGETIDEEMLSTLQNGKPIIISELKM